MAFGYSQDFFGPLDGLGDSGYALGCSGTYVCGHVLTIKHLCVEKKKAPNVAGALATLILPQMIQCYEGICSTQQILARHTPIFGLSQPGWVIVQISFTWRSPTAKAVGFRLLIQPIQAAAVSKD